ncbi:MAG: AAA family ATPase, partial [Nitrospirae bacterium]
MEILTYRNAGYPAVAVQTVEEDRLATVLLDALTANQDDTFQIFSIAATGGIFDLRQQRTIDPSCTYPKAFFEISNKKDQILLVLDFHHVIKNPSAYRSLKLAIPRLKANGNFVILIAPSWQLPPELEHDIPVLDFKLPTPEELSRALDVCVNDLRPLNPEIDRVLTPERRQAALQAARGLTLVQAENVFALAAQSAFDRTPIEQEKLKIIKQTGYMQVSPPNPPDAIGGLLGIKDYFETEVIPAKDDPDLAVRGMLLVGIPGTGKSLCARTAGAWLQWPVIRLDLGACKGSLVGQTEQNVRKALA